MSKSMQVIVRWCLFALLLIAAPASAQERIGVVLMHGKWGTTGGLIQPLADTLRARNFLVATPLMPWGRGRDYDAGYPQAIEEISAEIRKLREQGATKIVVAGHSFGANAALAYGASAGGIDGIAAVAPGHVPDLASFRRHIGPSVEKARGMIAAGKGDERTSFEDLNQGKTATISTTPRVYMSYFDSEGLAAMPRSAASIKAATPLLWVIGTRDALHSAGPAYAFGRAPAHAKSKYLVVESDHAGTPRDAAADIASWIEGLGP